MTDLISRQAAINVVHKTIFDFFDICSDDDESPITYVDEKLLELNKAITAQIRALPSEEPVKHGRWEFEAKWQYKNCDGRGMERKEIFGTTKRTCNRLKCSKCKKAVVIDDTIAYAYCPNCGAKMNEEGEGHEQN